MDRTKPSAHHGEHEADRLKLALGLILAFITVEVVVAVLASSLALLSDAAHMLTDAAALALALLAARLAGRPAKGVMTFGLGRAEILSAQANGLTLLVLSLLIVYGAIRHLVTPISVDGVPMLVVAIVGIAVNLVVTLMLGSHRAAHETQPHAADHASTHGPTDRTYLSAAHAGHSHDTSHEHAAAGAEWRTHIRSLNLEGSYQHILTDLFGFIATAAAAVVIICAGFGRADSIASLLIAAVMLRSSVGLLR
ncbi:MAG: cation diffusion facilitator family transporter, partial [Solirubrobacteraceae bacterium]